MPILKQLVSNTAHSKRRSRADLTAEMISAPLGDFRHTMHVGRAGDAFGDTSFLNSKAGEPEPPAESGSSKLVVRPQPVTRGDRRDMLGSLRDSAIFVKNAVSLPQLNEKEADKSAGKLPKSLSSSPVKKAPEEAAAPEQTLRANGAAARPQSPSLDERDFGDLTELPVVVPKSSYGMKHAESIMSFHIDLGPSMLGDVLSIMDKDEWDQQEDLGAMVTEEPWRDGGPTRVPAAHQLIREGNPDSLRTGTPPVSRKTEMPGTALPSGPTRSSPSRMRRTTRSECSKARLKKRHPSPARQSYGVPADAGHGPPKRPDKEFSFADEEDDEIRV
uniref:CDC42 effector protein 4 n=1 Tax=Pelodiscus sinensis TaxID=13735 RepID=K7F774_PELSI